MFRIEQYKSDKFDEWNLFIEQSKNGTFLFNRNFMEYHSDRFEDFSLLIYKKDKLIALLPANIVGDKVYSHQGLTYGGLILPLKIGYAIVEAIFTEIISFLKANSITNFIYKSIPFLYLKVPALELESLFINNAAKITRRDQNFAINYKVALDIHKTKIKHFTKNHSLGFEIKQSNNCDEFWKKVLCPRLNEKHKTTPVHSNLEMNFLMKQFPNQIIQYDIYLDDEILAGITIFKADTVIKSQYGATTVKGEKQRALDYLFIYLINYFKERGYHYFDMGTATGNLGLIKQKEELGCSLYNLDQYELSL